MDAQLGRLLRWLTEEGLTDSTIVIFLSDNGPVTSDWFYWFELNAHGSTGGLRGRKHFLYEGGIRVPALIRYPNVTKAGDLSHEIVVGMDLFVTLTKLAGGEVPNDRPIDGIDISKALKGGRCLIELSRGVSRLFQRSNSRFGEVTGNCFPTAISSQCSFLILQKIR